MIEIRPHISKKPNGEPLFPDGRSLFVDGKLVGYVHNKKVQFLKPGLPIDEDEVKKAVENYYQDKPKKNEPRTISDPDPVETEDGDD